MLCDTGSGDVEKSPIWGLGSSGGDADEVEISTVSITQCPAYSYIHSSTSDIFSEVNAGEGGDRGGTWKDEMMSIKLFFFIFIKLCMLYFYNKLVIQKNMHSNRQKSS